MSHQKMGGAKAALPQAVQGSVAGPLELVHVYRLQAQLKELLPAERWRHLRKSVPVSSPAFLTFRFLEVFCEPDSRKVPARKMPDGSYAVAPETRITDFKAEDLLPLISQKRVSKSLLVNLGILDQKDSYESLTPEILSSLMQVFNRLTPLIGSDGYIEGVSQRFWVAGPGADRKYDSLSGSIVRITSYPDEEVPLEGRREAPLNVTRLSSYSTLPKCLRALDQEMARMIKEMLEQSRLLVPCGNLADDFWNYSTKDASGKEAVLQAAQELAGQAVETMPKPKDWDKRKARDRIGKSISIHDSRGFNNPAAGAMRIQGSSKNIRNRIKRLSGMLSFIHADYLNLVSLQQVSQSVFENAFAHLRHSIHITGDKPFPMFNPKLKPSIRIAQVTNYLASLKLGAELLNRFSFRPFSAFGQAIERWREQTAVIAGSDDLSAGKDCVAGLKTILAVFTETYPIYLRARSEMNGDRGLFVGKQSLLQYLGNLKVALKSPQASALLPDPAQMLEVLQEVEQKLLEFRVPKNMTALTYLKRKLADPVDLELLMRQAGNV